MKYRKKPVMVEAFQLTDDPEMIAPKWFTQAVADESVWIDRSIVDGHARLRLHDQRKRRQDARKAWRLHHPGSRRQDIPMQPERIPEEL